MGLSSRRGEAILRAEDLRTAAALPYFEGLAETSVQQLLAGAHGVKVTGKSVEVTDLARLEALAQPVPIIDDPAY